MCGDVLPRMWVMVEKRQRLMMLVNLLILSWIEIYIINKMIEKQ